MTHMHLYHFSDSNLGDVVELYPQIPRFTAEGEENYTPRICCCTSVTNCIEAIDYIPESVMESKDGYIDLYLYKADIPVEDIYQPSIIEVGDAWKTGEVWVTEPHVFNLVSRYRVRSHINYPNYGLSRFSFTNQYVDEVCDRAYAESVYGGIGAFSMLLANPAFHDRAIDYYNQNPYF